TLRRASADVGASLLAKLLGFGLRGYGSLSGLAEALVSPCWASPFWQSPDGRPRPNEPKSLAPASGSRCARLPSLHPRSGGRRTRAIHGPLRLARHPCRSLPSTRTPFGLLKGAVWWRLRGRAAKH